jgi:hypothetical protein
MEFAWTGGAPASSPLGWCQMAARFHPAEVVRRHYEPLGAPKKEAHNFKSYFVTVNFDLFRAAGASQLTELSCEPGGVCTCTDLFS